MRNAVDISFFESGHGKNFKVRNLAHALAGSKTERLTYAPNNFQQYYDDDLDKMLYYVGEKWIDSNGVAVDLPVEGEESV